MAVEISALCEESAGTYSVQVLSIALAIVFGLYILFDAMLGAFTVGAKAYQLLSIDQNKEVEKSEVYTPSVK